MDGFNELFDVIKKGNKKHHKKKKSKKKKSKKKDNGLEIFRDFSKLATKKANNQPSITNGLEKRSQTSKNIEKNKKNKVLQRRILGDDRIFFIL